MSDVMQLGSVGQQSSAVHCVVCTGYMAHGHRACCDLNYWIISLHKVRALKDVLSKFVNESTQCCMATDMNSQL
jgi:hypothetical protein